MRKLFLLVLTSVLAIALTACPASPPPNKADFSININPSQINIVQGSSTSFSVQIEKSEGFVGDVEVEVVSPPSGMSFGPNTNSAQNNPSFSLNTNEQAYLGEHSITIEAKANGMVKKTNLKITVTEPPKPADFGLKIKSLSILQGHSGEAAVELDKINGFKDSVALSISGLPQGITAKFEEQNISKNTQIRFNIAKDTAPAVYELVLSGKSKNLEHSQKFKITVAELGEFRLELEPSLVLEKNTNNSSLVKLIRTGSYIGQELELSVGDLPAGLKASFAHDYTTANSTWLSLYADSELVNDNYMITVSAKKDDMSVSAQIQISVIDAPQRPDFSITATDVTINQGESGNSVISIHRVGYFSHAIELEVVGLPDGVSGVFETNPATDSSLLVLDVASKVEAKSYTIIVNGGGQDCLRSTEFLLTISKKAVDLDFSLAATDVTISAAPVGAKSTKNSPNLSQNISNDLSSTGSSSITINRSSGFTELIDLTVLGVPDGVTSSFNPSQAANSSTLSFTANSTAKAGNYSLIVTGKANNLERTTQMTLTIEASEPVGEFSFGIQPVISINQGAEGSATMPVARGGAFADRAVEFSISGLPLGVNASFNLPANGTGNVVFLVLQVANSVEAKDYPLTVTGTIDGTSHSKEIILTVKDLPNGEFSFGIQPAITIVQGSEGSATIAIARSGSFSDRNVAFSIAGTPSGVTSSFNLAPNSTGNVAFLVLQVDSSVVAKDYPLTVTGTIDGKSLTKEIVLTVRAILID